MSSTASGFQCPRRLVVCFLESTTHLLHSRLSKPFGSFCVVSLMQAGVSKDQMHMKEGSCFWEFKQCTCIHNRAKKNRAREVRYASKQETTISSTSTGSHHDRIFAISSSHRQQHSSIQTCRTSRNQIQPSSKPISRHSNLLLKNRQCSGIISTT